jgi:hypothetical protein
VIEKEATDSVQLKEWVLREGQGGARSIGGLGGGPKNKNPNKTSEEDKLSSRQKVLMYCIRIPRFWIQSCRSFSDQNQGEGSLGEKTNLLEQSPLTIEHDHTHLVTGSSHCQFTTIPRSIRHISTSYPPWEL